MQSYLITAKPSYSTLRRYMPDFALYRDKDNSAYALEAQNFLAMAKPFKNMKTFLHQEADLAKKLGATGVHLTSMQFDDITHAKELGLEVIISTHTQEEVHLAEVRGADYVTYSPIFATPNKGEPKGVDALREIVEKSKIKIFALGGIVSDEEVEKLEGSGAFGFASIRYFTN